MINPQWLELPMSRTNFHGPKDVRAIEVRLYLDIISTGCDIRDHILNLKGFATGPPQNNQDPTEYIFI